MRTRNALTALVGVTLAAAGCASATPVKPVAAPPTTVVGADCPQPAETGGHPAPELPGARGGLPADFVPVSALTCSIDSVDIPGEGRWTVLQERRASTGLDAYITALRAPSVPPGKDIACAAVGYVQAYLVLIDAAGEGLLVGAPTDACGAPQQAVLSAGTAVPWKLVKQTKIKQVETPLAQAVGCDQQVKDMFAVGGHQPAPGPITAAVGPALKVCEYGLPAGDFIAGWDLTGGALATVRAALTASSPAPAECTLPASRFAVLEDGQTWYYVELDGCHRALDRGFSGAHSFDARALAELTGGSTS